jgi:hypothetical protein
MPLDSITNGPFLGTSRNPFSYEKIEQVDRDIVSSWLTLDEITQQLNLFQDESQDEFLINLELATRMAIEDYLGLTIFPVTYRVYYGATNSYGVQMILDLPEVSQDFGNNKGVTIKTVAYYNGDTPPILQTLTASQYYYDKTGNKVVLNSGLPSNVSTIMTSPIVVTYQTYPSIISQYPVIKQAALLLLTHLYNNRSNTVAGNIGLKDIPFGVAQLLRPYKPLVL